MGSSPGLGLDPSPRLLRLGSSMNWFSASSEWYTQDTSGLSSKDPTYLQGAKATPPSTTNRVKEKQKRESVVCVFFPSFGRFFRLLHGLLTSLIENQGEGEGVGKSRKDTLLRTQRCSCLSGRCLPLSA